MITNEIMNITTNERRTWFGLQFVMVILLQNISQLVYLSLYALFSGRGFTVDFASKVFLVSELFSTALTILIFLVYALFVEKRSLVSLGFNYKRFLFEGFKGWLLGSTCIYLIVTIVDKLVRAQLVFTDNIDVGLIILYLIGFIIQGLSEEVIFRGYLMNGLATRLKPFTAIVISSFIFALVHILNGHFFVWNFLSLLFLGLLLGLLFYERQNIWFVAGLHAGWNFTLGVIFGSNISSIDLGISVFKTNFYSKSPILSGGHFGLEGSFIATIVLVMGCLIYYVHFIRS
ncbi:type II CAAX endopeptidase family protein [Lactobacillus sp. UCMA15818]|uniref:CPBP family intramembrane glutamic endopeptidase n=1 Tax=Lactobacillus sp. UCMA15818 TaxID=2583394 RepID=UPI0025B247F7|nr:type II CAAX endopeptidase family protein [Lactobacillus sp. UCMA15818]MDN2453409.1 CPBP family intramembrane metalloprotease [Lactobacillus sp. UCMA15818]